jgi:hypothetical protein
MRSYNPELLELNDSRKELRGQLREALTLSTTKPMDLERCNEVIKHLRGALEIAEEIREMLTE